MRQSTAYEVKSGRSKKRADRPTKSSAADRLLSVLIDGFPHRLPEKVLGFRAWQASRQLTLSYGMEIEIPKRGTYRLLGEWDGPFFIPVERMEYDL
jgi:hypothetical protein